MSDSTETPGLAAAREARKALAASSVPFRHREWWEVWCNGEPEHMLSTTAALPDGECEVRPERWETMFHHCDECDAETDRRGWDLADPEPFAADIRRREWDYPAHENQVDARHLRVALAEVDRLTEEIGTMTGLFREEVTSQRKAHRKHVAGIRAKLDGVRLERDTALADLSALRLEHEAHAILLDCARRERDEARAALRATVGVAPTPSRVVLIGDDTDLHQLAHALRADPVREALDAMPALDLTAWIDAPMDAPLNRAQKRAKDKR